MLSSDAAELPPRVVAAIRVLQVNAVTVEVLGALTAAGHRSILLKGPTFQRELHRDGSLRTYSDTDLLVAPQSLAPVGGILAGLGFRLVGDDAVHPVIPEPHAQQWRRKPGGPAVDLHWRVPGVGAGPVRAWDVLLGHTEPIEIGAAVGEALDRPGIALVAALHAAHHGRRMEKPLRDLERALHLIDEDAWTRAARLAAQLDATEGFAAGLSLVPGGERLVEALRIPRYASPRRRLLADTGPPASHGLLWILESPTARARVRALRATIAPSSDFMRTAFPRARRGRAGLALAYAQRLATRSWQLPRAVRAVRRARRTP